ncbi:hypothetical protein [Methylophaga pinxianii]|uniref:hypothetical protein n=1 Tax=Methylophaga pinxianii TaxID=2881052 RepID=UPI001CF413BE|nr:hypothetical protein [Methylophaga pinxianii]MCB2426837.1 hypothetical protein [Methylophaga pinxianii]UPH47049.1 hypothetical protein LGT42_007160 [Methylophaga pinxianii]
MSQTDPQYIQDPQSCSFHGDDDRRRYQRRQNMERRQLIRFDLSHVKRRSGQDRRVLSGNLNRTRSSH